MERLNETQKVFLRNLINSRMTTLRERDYLDERITHKEAREEYESLGAIKEILNIN